MQYSRLFLILVSCALPAVAAAEPVTFALQGHLRSQAGAPAPDGTYPLAVALYADETAKQPIFLEKFLAVPVQGGLFALQLGTADPTKKLDDSVFLGAAPAQWVGIQIAADPELGRAPLREVPYALHARGASKAFGLSCSACVTKETLAVGAVESQHVAFAYAGSKAKGGPAETALVAEQAKVADVAKVADKAISADEAKTAAVAASVQCTGCLGVGHVAKTFTADLAKAGQLAPVALSGNYADLTGGPDLAPFAELGKANTWPQMQTFGADVQFAKHQALLMRVQNGVKDPVACDDSAIGLLYYNTATQALMLCNGKAFVTFATAADAGTAKNPGASCQALMGQGQTKSGIYTLDPDGAGGAAPVLAYCDQETDGGGWTKVMSSKYKHFFTSTNWQALAADTPGAENYSMLAMRQAFVQGGVWTLRLTVGNSGTWNSAGTQAHKTMWQQQHDPFTATTAGADYKLLGGDVSSTCGGFNGLHHKYQGHSYTSDPDTNDGIGCWWMQVVPHTDYDGKGYLEGYGGSGNYHVWQVLWMR